MAPRRLATTLAATAAVVALGATSAQAAPGHQYPGYPGGGAKTVDVRIVSINDFHGNLQPPAGSSGRVTITPATATTQAVNVQAGGAAFLATAVKAARAEVKNSLLVAAGDLIGASPLPSALFHDEPTIDFLNYLGLQASSVGNHEFDEGYKELLRIQLGGCHPTDGCQFEPTYGGAKFPYLGANVTFDNGLPALLPATIKIVDGVPVGIIGAPLEGVPDVVTPQAIEGLNFGDEVTAINKTSKLLSLFGIRAQIVLLHQGDTALPGGPNDCNLAPDGLGSTIAKNVTPAVDAIFSGHSHQGYNCVINDPAGNPRTFTQGASFGRLVTVLDLKIDRKSRDVIRAESKAENRVVVNNTNPVGAPGEYAADPGAQAIVDEAVTKSAPIANQLVGTITADITRTSPLVPGTTLSTGETPLGDVIADAQLAATADSAGAQIAITNPGGIRTDLTYASSPAGEGDGVVTYGEAFAVQPFSNIMQTITLTGAQLDAVLEQQYSGANAVVNKTLQISAGFTYTYTPGAAAGDKISALALNGVPIDPATGYRVSVNNFLAAGGDGFTVFAEGTDLVGGPVDLDAFTAYLTANPGLAPPVPNRVTLVP